MAYADRHLLSLAVDLNGLAVQKLFAALNRIDVHKVGVRVDGTDTAGSSMVFARRRGASTDTTIATVVVPAANSAGNLYYKEVTTPTELLAGDEIIVTTTEGGGAQAAVLVVEYSIRDVDLPSGTAIVSA